MNPSFSDVVEAAQRIAPHVHRTPVLTSQYVDEEVGAEVFFKAENFQKVGAFKARGATNAVLALTDERADAGIVTHSSGNHGQAVAYAAAIRGVPATIVMPDHAPDVKIDAVRGYGASVVFVPQPEREAAVAELITERGYTLVHPFDDPMVIAGQGTATLELVDEVPDLDMVIAPIGGGGLLSGATLVGDRMGVRTVGAEPEIVDDAFRSMRDGVRHPATGEISVGDGLLTGIGEIAFRVLHGAAVEILTVSEAEILDAVRLHAERMKIIVEPSGATVLAALLRYRDRFDGQRIGAIISGGNLRLDLLTATA